MVLTTVRSATGKETKKNLLDWAARLFLVTLLRPVTKKRAEWKPDTVSDMEKYL